MTTVSTILTNNEIEEILAADYGRNYSSTKEYTPNFLDSIADLENRTKFNVGYMGNVTKMPARVIVELDEELITA